MKKLIALCILTAATSSFAFNCKELASLPDVKIKIAMDLAMQNGMTIIDTSVKTVSNRIRAERDLELRLLDCQQTISIEKTALIRANSLNEEEDVHDFEHGYSCYNLSSFKDSSVDLVVNLMKSTGNNIINRSVKDVSQKIRATRDMELFLLGCEQVVSQRKSEKIWEELRSLREDDSDSLIINESQRSTSKDSIQNSNKIINRIKVIKS